MERVPPSGLTDGGGDPNGGTSHAVGNDNAHDGDSVVRQFVLAYAIVVIIAAVDSSLAADLQLRSVQKQLGTSIIRNTLGIVRQRHAHDATGNAAPDFSPASKLSIPLPNPQLLVRQPAPDCQFKSAAKIDDDVALSTIMKLDYEQQCYRQSESILRARLDELQDAASKTIESLK